MNNKVIEEFEESQCYHKICDNREVTEEFGKIVVIKKLRESGSNRKTWDNHNVIEVHRKTLTY